MSSKVYRTLTVETLDETNRDIGSLLTPHGTDGDAILAIHGIGNAAAARSGSTILASQVKDGNTAAIGVDFGVVGASTPRKGA